jgi:hypothetical protein
LRPFPAGRTSRGNLRGIAALLRHSIKKPALTPIALSEAYQDRSVCILSLGLPAFRQLAPSNTPLDRRCSARFQQERRLP